MDTPGFRDEDETFMHTGIALLRIELARQDGTMTDSAAADAMAFELAALDDLRSVIRALTILGLSGLQIAAAHSPIGMGPDGFLNGFERGLREDGI